MPDQEFTAAKDARDNGATAKRRRVLAFALTLAVLLAPLPAHAAILRDQSITYMFTLFLPLLFLIVPYKIYTMAIAVRRPAAFYILPVLIATAISLYLMVPLTYLRMPFDPSRHEVLLAAGAGLLFVVCFFIDSIVFLILRPWDGIERVMFGTIKANSIVFIGMTLICVFLWNTAGDAYQTINDFVLTMTVTVYPYTLMPMLQ